MHPRRLLVLGAGPFQIGLLTSARHFGVETIAVDGNAAAPGFRHADIAEVVDLKAVGAIAEVGRRYGVSGVVSSASDIALPAQAFVAQALGLPGPRVDWVTQTRDKNWVAQQLLTHGIQHPKTTYWDRATPITLDPPFVVKPVSAAGGRGVSIVESDSKVTAAVEKAQQYCDEIIIQEYIGGTPIGVEAFFWKGKCIATFIMDDTLASPFPSPVGHTYPSRLSQDAHSRICHIVAACGTALGMSSGGLNLDLRMCTDKPVILEVNPRPGGAAIAQLLKAAAGVDIDGAAVACALGESPLPYLMQTEQNAVASRMFVTQISPRSAPTDIALAKLRGRNDVLDLQSTMPETGSPPAVDEWYIVGRCLVTGLKPEDAHEGVERIENDYLSLLGIKRDQG